MTARMPDHDSPPQGGVSELASFGEDLRREREIRGISLKEIADATKISKRFLEAMEKNDHRTLPAPVFTRGFVREYARYVGLNAEEMVNRYNYAALQDDRIEKPPQIEKYPQTLPRDISPKPKPKRGIPAWYTRIDRNIVVLFVIAVALAGVAYWAIRQKFAERDSAAEPTVTMAAARSGAAPAPGAGPVAEAATAPPVVDTKLRLEIVGTDDAWLQLKIDDGPVTEIDLKRDETLAYEAEKRFEFVTIGNAAGVTLRLNGIEVPPFGRTRQVVRNRVFDHEALARLRSEEQKEQP